MGSLWDEGDIAGAVRKSKQLGAVFIVFIEGKDELSDHYGKLFTNEEVLKKLKTNQFVAIKVEQNSETHAQFALLYPHSSTPCIFFIGQNGKALQVVTKNITLEEFSSTINEVLERSGFSTKADITATILDEEKKTEASSSTANTSTAAVKEDSEPSLSASSKELSPEDKVQHAKEMIEQRKEAKKKQEEENERLKELERRKMGQSVQQMKKWQQDEELKQMMEERNKEKKENQAARDRVLAQIAQDKAERAAKFSKQGSASAPSIPQATAQSSRVVPKGNTTKLQFRLPDGSVHTQEFQISDTLQRVHQYILNEITIPFANYTISTTFPRREFNESDNSQTLLDLQLVPNAVILILPQMQGGVVSSGNSGVLGNMFWWMMSPILSIYDFLVGFIFGTPSIRRNGPPTNAKRSAAEAEVTNRNQPKKQATNTSEIKKQGNIHRLKERPDTDDENNTWNGNSTQQM